MKKILPLLMAAALFAGCLDDSPPRPDRGTGKLSLTGLTSTGTFVEPSRSTEDPVDVNDFAVIIRNSQGQEVKSWAKFGDITGEIELAVGSYTVEAGTADPQPAAFDQPVFSGTQPFEIRELQTETVSVECKLANMKVTVDVEESFSDELENYQITVYHTDNAANHLVFHPAEPHTSGYFSVAPLTVHIRATRKSSGSEVVQSYAITEVAAQDHHILKLSAQRNGQLGLTITVDYTLNDVEHEIVIPIDDDDEEIAITGPGIASALTLDDSQAGVTPVPIVFTVPEGIAELWVTVPAAVLAILDAEMGAAVAAPFDLADLPAGLREVLVDLEMIPAAGTIAGSTDFTLDLTALMGQVASDPSGDPETHAFTVKVVDEADEELQKSVTIIREKGGAVAPDAPSIERGEAGKTMTETFTLAQTASAQVSVRISAPNKIKELWVDIQSTALSSMLAASNPPVGSPFDLADPTDNAAIYFGPGKDLELITELIAGEEECVFDISTFVPLLALPMPGLGVGTYGFGIRVVDEDGEEASDTLTIILTE